MRENAQIQLLSVVITLIGMLTVITNNLEKFIKAMKRLVDAWHKLIQDIKDKHS
ncbi:hypothetical protein JCM14202_3743 [Agrilactobacillus composti DSM 18527 = JCM 14202]|nr:hypothetical protein JCM14202_3743 [Agrilactobacillus composti DSM 18527 = JCM 14202]